MIVVKFDDRSHKLYPPIESCSKSHAGHKSLQSAEFSDVQVAIQFYSSKFNEYHPATVRNIGRARR